MKKVLLDRTPLWEIRPEEQVIPDINSLQADNSREQAKLYYEANKEEIWTNTLRKKDKEIEKLNNIINKAIEKINDYKIYCENNKGFTEYTDIEIEAIEPVISKLEDILKEVSE